MLPTPEEYNVITDELVQSYLRNFFLITKALELTLFNSLIIYLF